MMPITIEVVPRALRLLLHRQALRFELLLCAFVVRLHHREHRLHVGIEPAHREHAWRRQRPSNDWTGFVDNFREVLAVGREQAALLADRHGMGRYEALMDQYEPGLRCATVDRVFGEVRQWLPGLIRRVQERQAPVMHQGPGEDDAVDRARGGEPAQDPFLVVGERRQDQVVIVAAQDLADAGQEVDDQ